MEEKAAYSNQKSEVGGERLEKLTEESLLLIPRTVGSKACNRYPCDSRESGGLFVAHARAGRRSVARMYGTAGIGTLNWGAQTEVCATEEDGLSKFYD